MAKETPTKPAVLVVEMAVPEDQTVNPFEQVLETVKPLLGTGALVNVTNVYIGIDDFATQAIAAMKDVT